MPEGGSRSKIELSIHSSYAKAKRPLASAISLSSPLSFWLFLVLVVLVVLAKAFNASYFICSSLYLTSSFWWPSWVSLSTWRWCAKVKSSCHEKRNAPCAAQHYLAVKLTEERPSPRQRPTHQSCWGCSSRSLLQKTL